MYGRCADPEVGWLPTSAPGRHQGGHRAGGMARPRRHRRGGLSVKKTHDYIHHYRGYWSDGCKCRIQIYQEDERAPGVAVRVDAEVHVKLDLLGRRRSSRDPCPKRESKPLRASNPCCIALSLVTVPSYWADELPSSALPTA